MKKIKILFVVSTLRRCGPTNQLFNIVSNLDSNEFTAKILTLSEESEDSLKSKFVDANIDVESLKLSRIKGMMIGFRELKKVVSRFCPDVVHTQGIRSDGYGVKLQKLNIKAVATIRCIPTEDYLMKYGNFLGKIMARKHLSYLKKLDRAVSVSQSINKILMTLGVQTETIQNGCDLDRYVLASEEEKTLIRRKLDLPQDKLLIISVGHLSNLKDPFTIINAFKKSLNRDSFHLMFVGDGELREECEKETQGDADIQLIGRVTNVEEYLKASDIFISASLSEGLPNTVLESLACGVPTILSKIPQHEEIFGNQEAYGFFYVKNEAELKSIIENISIEKLKSLPTRMIVEENFDAKNMSFRYQMIYKQLLG